MYPGLRAFRSKLHRKSSYSTTSNDGCTRGARSRISSTQYRALSAQSSPQSCIGQLEGPYSSTRAVPEQHGLLTFETSGYKYMTTADPEDVRLSATKDPKVGVFSARLQMLLEDHEANLRRDSSRWCMTHQFGRQLCGRVYLPENVLQDFAHSTLLAVVLLVRVPWDSTSASAATWIERERLRMSSASGSWRSRARRATRPRSIPFQVTRARR